MSFPKLKGDASENTAAEAAQKSSRNLEQLKPGIDEGDDESDLATMRMQRDEFKAKLDAALLNIERLEAAASEPCARCHFYSDWTVRVRTMSGQVYTIPCPDGPKTLVAHVKQKLAQFDPKCHILQQVTLVLPCEASSSCSAAPTDPALADDRTLASYSLSNRNLVDLLLVDMNWSDGCLQMIDHIKNCGEKESFSDIDDDLALAISWALVNAINPALSSLFFFSRLSAGAASNICAALCALSTAECRQAGLRFSGLGFSDNELGDALADSCSELIRVSTWLEVLNLLECGITSVGAVSIGSALRTSAASQLQTLDLSGNHIGSDGSKSIGAALSVNTSLTRLYLSGNSINFCGTNIDAGGVKALAEALKVNHSLRELFMGGCEIFSSGAAHFADALQLNSSLRFISLGSNKIGDDGAVLLSAAVRVNSGLESIDLFENEIGDRGATAFGAALRANTCLLSLDLSDNKIGDAGAGVLGIALAVNSSLTSIKLDNNIIGDAGAVVLGEALCANSSIKEFTLFDNKLGALGAESIRKAQRENSRLEPISLS